MGKVFLVLAAVVLTVYCLYDLVATPRDRVQHMPKWGWALLIVLAPYAGALLWIIFGVAKGRSTGGPRRPGPPRPLGPDDDPDYLRGL
ncbi:PLD nuclease N-terminal domain-containing protein [Aeromicrobium duanguangcaii]|uniref:PLD nuclease N-terminal domain-containing protein n=1 Tax=Aeromicrobium duanguangcaii TaxID=2968086 RepID=A0ABY5KF09_9ACTN|nr:PLD nuclease N-terminal domain-containing protein [Aeromicrobium duanguangcaii]MCD9154022.1 PLD nuclease N-terminal domain-containing protein [Aeromicrobium duanguangcaii]MCL3837757.1 PLD nuclease N-terminal domain-containing protein [Aeromicrobium duanguangcaii]UUI68900.1 PLD nuclease N-terminal domain-containing protein [Aeromicrobium duanguangcaii]